MTKPDSALVRQILEMRAQGRPFGAIAQELGIARSTVQKYWHRSSKDGPPPEAPGEPDRLVVDRTSDDTLTATVTTLDRPRTEAEFRQAAGLGDDWICTHYNPRQWQGFYRLKDGAGHHTVTMHGAAASFRRVIGRRLKEAIDAEMGGIPTAPPTAPPDRQPSEQVASWGLWDAHLGMYAFGREVGNDYDMQIAVSRCCNSIDDMAAELEPYKLSEIWMPIGNDFMHFDNVRQRTTQGEHGLDCDSRFARVYRGAVKVQIYAVAAALRVANVVRCFWIPGNHDTLTSYTLSVMLREHFRHDRRVVVDCGDSPKKIMRHGGVAVLYDHGGEVKPAHYPILFNELVMADARARGLSRDLTYREVQIGHYHQKRVDVYQAETPTNGVNVVVNPALCGTDYWHFSQGLLGQPMKSVEARRYDRTGLRGTHVTWARDEHHAVE